MKVIYIFCQDGVAYWALPVPAKFSDLDHISRSQLVKHVKIAFV